jgi:catechol 2,3-dioxygenase-like lactoylglutathione lyase family enzyme
MYYFRLEKAATSRAEKLLVRIAMKPSFGFAPAVMLSICLIFAGCSKSPTDQPKAASDTPEKPQPVVRPPIIGVAHIGLRTDNLAAARKFYSGVLGFQEPFTVDNPPGKLLLTYFKVNDHQYVEVFPELKDAKQDRLSHISFETTDAEQMRAYLASRGVKVPEKLEPMLDGNRGFDVTDPDGHDVEFVQFMPGSLHTRNFGKFLPDSRISQRIIHLGVVVQEIGRAHV